MPPLPPAVWAIVAAVALPLVALCIATVYVLLRPATRRRVARWPLAGVLIFIGAAAIPWLTVWLAPITIKASIHGALELIGWLFLALLAFAMLVLLPLAALASAVVWARARSGSS
jgi:hypothetical protein